MLHASVVTSQFIGELLLYLVGEVQALALVEALGEREENIGLGAVGVEVVVGIGVVLQQDGGILFLCHIQVGLVFRLTHDEGLGATGRSGTLGRVAMDGNEHISVVAVGDGGSLAQLDELVGVSCIYDLDIRQVLLDIVAQLERHGQVEVFLFAILA